MVNAEEIDKEINKSKKERKKDKDYNSDLEVLCFEFQVKRAPQAGVSLQFLGEEKNGLHQLLKRTYQ
jgi:hypothetical protein